MTRKLLLETKSSPLSLHLWRQPGMSAGYLVNHVRAKAQRTPTSKYQVRFVTGAVTRPPTSPPLPRRHIPRFESPSWEKVNEPSPQAQMILSVSRVANPVIQVIMATIRRLCFSWESLVGQILMILSSRTTVI